MTVRERLLATVVAALAGQLLCDYILIAYLFVGPALDLGRPASPTQFTAAVLVAPALVGGGFGWFAPDLTAQAARRIRARLSRYWIS